MSAVSMRINLHFTRFCFFYFSLVLSPLFARSIAKCCQLFLAVAIRLWWAELSLARLAVRFQLDLVRRSVNGKYSFFCDCVPSKKKRSSQFLPLEKLSLCLCCRERS